MPDFHQWSTISDLIPSGLLPGWVTGLDQTRIAAYKAYEEMYWNQTDAFKLMQRGADSKPIYIPSGRQIVETMNRYMAPNMTMVPDPEIGTTSEQNDFLAAWRALAKRERFYSTFNINKRYGLMRGDWLFHVEGDPERVEGSRISITAVDPASYFPIYNEDNVDEVIGGHIAEVILDNEGKERIYRLTYRKLTGTGGPSPLSAQEAIFEMDKWGGPNMEEGRPLVIIREEELPPEITAIPLYHIPNSGETGTVWGSSEMRGIESIIGHINQGISDEELELVLNGLGVYATDSGPPIDETTGEELPWNLGPARVIELPDGKTFTRITGTTTVAPYQDHIRYLHEQLDQTFGMSAIAKGKVDVSVAESGVALALEMGPILSRGEEKELVVTDVLGNMLFDLKAFFNVYENIDTGDAILLPAYGDKIPPNRKEKFNEIMSLLGSPIPVVSAQWARDELMKLGYTFPAGTAMLNQILEEKIALAQIVTDVTGARIDEELGEEEEAPVPSGNGREP